MKTIKLPRVPKSTTQAIVKIKEKGFPYIKIELEANLHRGDRERSCDDCNDGYNPCVDCNSTGFITLENDTEAECRDCMGDGSIEHSDCGGTGYERTEYDTDECYDLLRSHLSAHTLNILAFDKFYDDGSVDSEYTFTIPVDELASAIEIIDAFKALSREITGESSVDINNAGMHISLLTESKYPTYHELPSRYISNFKREVTKLLPALYFLGTHNHRTRSLEYRYPKVSSEDKYSAIYTHSDTCLEYRLFDPCFDEPLALYEKVETIAATLNYFSTHKTKANYNAFYIPSESQLKAWFNTLPNYQVLEACLPSLKPARKTSKKLLEERRVMSKKDLLAQMKVERNTLKLSAKDYLARVTRNARTYSILTLEPDHNSTTY